jgi:hypothetical protein
MNVSEQTNVLFILKSGNFKNYGMGIQTIISADFRQTCYCGYCAYHGFVTKIRNTLT